jgi:hypothetical protein
VKLTGRIIFYNDTIGNGIILTEDRRKFNFSINDWEDFDYLPEIGLSVAFGSRNGVAKSIYVPNDSTSLKSSLAKRKKQSITTESVIEGYFNAMNHDLGDFAVYNRALHSIDFLRLRRFLFTSFNNLTEIDSSLLQTEINSMKEDLLKISAIYDSFKLRSKQMKKAFHELFLDQSEEFTKAKEKLEKNGVTLGQYELNITMAEIELKALEHSIGENESEENNYELIERAIKRARAVMVDAIHNKRELEEENRRLIEFIDMMISENEESFKVKFTTQAEIFNAKIISLLNKVAYVFETTLWKKARKSRFIRKHFSRTQTNERLSSTAYLKYYLRSLDMEKLSEDKKELYDLVPYMESLQTRSVVYFYEKSISAQKIKQVLLEIDKEIDFRASTRAHQILKILDDDLPDFLFIDQRTDFKAIFHYLRKYELLEELTIVFFMDKITANTLERAEELGIDYLIPTNVTTSQLGDLLREYLI